MSREEGLIKLRDINLTFGSLQVLDHLNLTIRPGEIHALMGEHGAGKSSIAKIISGYMTPQNGSIEIQDKSYSALSLRAAKSLNIRMVYQEFSLNRYFTVAENLFYTDKKIPFFSLRHGALLTERAKNFLNGHSFNIDPKQLTNTLNLSDRTIIEILANITTAPSLLILDESLEKISAAALPQILDIIHQLKSRGGSILIITHKIDGVYDLADRISIIRNGQTIFTDEIKQVDKIQLIKMAYTQMIELDDNQENYTTFYELIKYNEAILINLPVNLIIIDTQKNIRLLNKFCQINYDVTLQSYMGKQISRLFEGTTKVSLDMIMRGINTFQEEQIFHIKLKINAQEGIFNLRFFPIEDDGFLIGNIILLEDITEYSDRQKREIISDKLSSLGLLAASVAHEINNPLEIIYSYLTNMRFKFGSKDLQAILAKLQKELDYITHIVSNLQDFSGDKKVAIEETDVNLQIREILDLIHYNTTMNRIKVRFDADTQDCVISINRNELKQVLLNLFKNSIEAMPEGGDISITTSIQYSGEQKVLNIKFRDSGTGIPENRDLFVPFYSTKQKENKISGLGLTICHTIVNKYKGSININNNKEGGCLVTIAFPIL